MFRDNGMYFNLQLEKIRGDTSAVEQLANYYVFFAWLDDWEEEILKSKDCFAEAALSEKYMNLVFNDPDKKIKLTVYHKNFEYHQGKDRGWTLIGIPSGDDKHAAYLINIALELITKTSQKSKDYMQQGQ